MKINSLQNISLNSKQKILDRNIRFYVQNYADHFSKGQNIAFKGKEDEEKYLLDYRNIAINDEYLDKLSDGRAVKQTATIINFDRLPEINIEEMFEKAKKQGVYKAKLNAREILECEYYPKFNTYSIISYDGKNPKNQKILKGKAIEEQFLSCYDSICEIREDKETKNDRQFLNNLMINF